MQSIIRIFTEAAPRPALVTATMWYEYEPLLTSAKLRASTPPRVNKKYSLENIVPSYHTVTFVKTSALLNLVPMF